MSAPLGPLAPVLSYAVERDAYDVLVEEAARGVTLTVPPVRRWSAMPRHERVLTVLGGGVMLATAVGNMSGGLVAPTVFFTLAFVGIMARTYWRLNRWIAIEVTADTVAVRQGLRARGGTARLWPRNPGLAIWLDYSGMSLVVRHPAREITMVPLGRFRAANERLIGELQAVLRRELPVSPAAESAASRPLARAWVVAIRLAGVAVFAAMLWSPWAGYAVFPLAILLGLRFGEQKRDFWA